MRDTRIFLQIPTHTTNNTPKSVNHECWKFLFMVLNREVRSFLPRSIQKLVLLVESWGCKMVLFVEFWENEGVHWIVLSLSLSPMCNHMCRQVGALCLLREQIIWLCMCSELQSKYLVSCSNFYFLALCSTRGIESIVVIDSNHSKNVKNITFFLIFVMLRIVLETFILTIVVKAYQNRWLLFSFHD